jgi:PAS domain S-box-containing protein
MNRKSLDIMPFVTVYNETGSFDNVLSLSLNIMDKPFPDIVMKLNRDGAIKEFRSGLVNDSTLEGKSLNCLYDDKLSGFIRNDVVLALETETMRIIQYFVKYNETCSHWFEGRILPLDQNEVFVVIRDIESDKTLNEQLISTAENCRAIIDASNIGIILLNKKGVVLDVNQTVARFMEMEKHQITGNLIFDLLPYSYKEGLLESFNEILGHDNEQLGEVNFKNRWISYKFKTFIESSPGAPAAVIYGRDVTLERHIKEGLLKALKADKENQEFLEQLINSIPDIIGIQDKDHRIVRYNAAGYVFTGLTHQEVVGRKCFELIGRESECVPCASRQCYSSRSPAFIERFFPEKGIWFDIRSYPVLDNEGEIKYVIEHLRDITALKKSQAELIKSRQRYWDLFNSSAAGILLGSPEGNIVEANEAFYKMTGYKREELIGLNISQSLFTEESMIESPFRFDLLKQGKTVSSKRKLKASGGSIIPIEMFTQIMPDGTYQSIYYDLTERHLAEEEINRQNLELKTLNVEKDRLFSIIAHDLRSPFSAILGLTAMISDEFDTMDANEVKDILKELHKSAGNLYKLLDNLLEWTMVRRNKKPFNPTDILLVDLIKYSIQTLTENARAKSIDVYIDMAEDLKVFADRNMLEVIVRNLFSNATKFTHNDGHITISAEQLPGNVVAVRVSDTGMGIPSEMLEKIFSVSERNNRRGTNGEPSAGLGLLLCKEFAEKNGGQIFVNSIEGEGSTFSFTIPACSVEMQNT